MEFNGKTLFAAGDFLTVSGAEEYTEEVEIGQDGTIKFGSFADEQEFGETFRVAVVREIRPDGNYNMYCMVLLGSGNVIYNYFNSSQHIETSVSEPAQIVDGQAVWNIDPEIVMYGLNYTVTYWRFKR